jgi:Lon protease-like protein
MANSKSWLPLLPLNAVLYPDGILPLKIFEARTIDMVRQCMREDRAFGVVLLKSGNENSASADLEGVGCIANIISWEMPQMGVLYLRARGGERFHILQTRFADTGRVEAEVAMLSPHDGDPAIAQPTTPVSDVHVRCAKALKLVIDDLHCKHLGGTEKSADTPFALPIKLDNAGWVADRWCEILPIRLIARQKLLELDDPEIRLRIVLKFLQQHQVL